MSPQHPLIFFKIFQIIFTLVRSNIKNNNVYLTTFFQIRYTLNVLNILKKDLYYIKILL